MPQTSSGVGWDWAGVRIMGEGGRVRESLEYTDLEHLVNKGAFNELGGLQHSSLSSSCLDKIFKSSKSGLVPLCVSGVDILFS